MSGARNKMKWFDSFSFSSTPAASPFILKFSFTVGIQHRDSDDEWRVNLPIKPAQIWVLK